MIWIFIISFVFVLSIGMAFYYDYKANKIGFKKSLFDGFVIVLIFIAIMIASNLIDKLWIFIVGKQ